jgi:hypothetical protein
MVEVSMKNKNYEWDDLERVMGTERFDEFLDKLEADFEKEFGNALCKQTKTVQKRVPTAKS